MQEIYGKKCMVGIKLLRAIGSRNAILRITEIVETPTTLPNRINIDTDAGRYGHLTAIELHARKIWQQL